ncbi:MIP/aquaporin family protein [Thalassospiraceae bacterium LMO-JJ14]|nr:MIP/aquaporin family protein [Thalassospiraceae bacterium LMO-JJ14]
MSIHPFQRRLLSEYIGTAGLLATVIGSGIMAERLAGGNDAVALLGNTLATGAMLVVLISAFGPMSGAHFNPAVTLAFMMRREIEKSHALVYIIVQDAGAITGMLVAHIMFEEQIFQLSTKIRSGPAQMFSEAVATFGLVLTIFGAIRHRPDSVAWMVGLYITAAYWFTASTSFANPAVTIARAMTDTFSGIQPVDAPFFIIAQFVGALGAVFIAGRLAYFDKNVD